MKTGMTLGTLSAAVAGCALAWTGLAGATYSTTSCPASPSASPFTGKVNAPGNLIIPAGEVCGLTQGSTVGHNVVVQKGAEFLAMGTRIGHDVLATHAHIIEIGNPNDGTSQVKVGYDLIIKDMQSAGGVGNFICQTKVGHNLILQGTSKNAPMFDVGYPDPFNCGRNSVAGDVVGHSMTITRNAGTVEVGSDKVHRALKFTYNRSASNVLYGNIAGSLCHYAHSRADQRAANTVKHGPNNCNLH
jgi:hypothetical protein